LNEFLPYVVAAYKSSCRETTGFSSKYLLSGKEIRTPLDLDLVNGQPSGTCTEGSTYSDYTLALQDRMDKASYTLVLQHLKERPKGLGKIMIYGSDKPDFDVGDWV